MSSPRGLNPTRLETFLKKDKHAEEILRILKKTYPNAECALIHRNAWELLIATILSAQCTDVRVNMVTPVLFKTYPTPETLAKAPIAKIERIIRSTGFYHNKAKAIKGASALIVKKFHGKVPRTIEELLQLPGVARKTANVVLGTAFGKNEGVVVDTHVKRLAARLGLSKHTSPAKIEQDLMALFPKNEWTNLSHMLIWHGRQICTARKPRCGDCPLNRVCPSAFKV
ncbi:MAG: endonuclease III [Candidatus Kerfeldbacteria bacterium]|nr:endonuclease III [Candidatus Kerfeldbacteria bacterium]